MGSRFSAAVGVCSASNIQPASPISTRELPRSSKFWKTYKTILKLFATAKRAQTNEANSIGTCLLFQVAAAGFSQS